VTATDDALRQAAQRLLSGTPVHSDGALTVKNLAKEAGVARASAYRSPILQEFRQAAANHDALEPTVTALRHENTALKAELRQLRARHGEEVKELRHDANGLLQLVQALTIQRDTLVRQVAQNASIANLDDRRNHSRTNGPAASP
jgi:regulator of replication initiation timing